MTLTFPKTRVPMEETNYYCMAFEFPQDGDYHMIATEPIIDNIHVMHHILLFGCTKKRRMKLCFTFQLTYSQGQDIEYKTKKTHKTFLPFAFNHGIIRPSVDESLLISFHY